MKKDKLNFIVSIIIIFVSFLGFPTGMKQIIFTICALLILIPALQDIRKESKIRSQMEIKDAFVESKPENNRNNGDIVENKAGESKRKSSHIADA